MKQEDIEYLKHIYKTKRDEYLFHVDLVNANIPLQYRHFEFDMLESNEIEQSKKVLKTYLEKLKTHGLSDTKIRGKGFYIFGNSGTAKTVFACILAKEILRLRKYTVYFIPFLELLQHFLNDNCTEFEDYNFLIIDDFGNFDIPKLSYGKFVTFLKTRYYRGNPSILTSTLTPLEIGKVFGDSMYSFIFECFYLIDHTKVSDWRKRRRERIV